MEQKYWKGLEIVTDENLEIGAKVVKGPDFDWYGQGIDESNKDLIGTLINNRGNHWANIKWSNGSTQTYRIGSKGKYDLVYLR